MVEASAHFGGARFSLLYRLSLYLRCRKHKAESIELKAFPLEIRHSGERRNPRTEHSEKVDEAVEPRSESGVHGKS